MYFTSPKSDTIQALSFHFIIMIKFPGLTDTEHTIHSNEELNSFGCYAIFLFLLICVQKVTYLGAFSCEVSWILEAHGDLPICAYLLCSGYFIMFIASTILIHGLATVTYFFTFCIFKFTVRHNYFTGLIMGFIQLVSGCWGVINSRIDFRYDYDHTVLGKCIVT